MEWSLLFNCVKGDRHKSDVLDAINLISGECDMFNHNDVKSAVASLSVNKACGMDCDSYGLPVTGCQPSIYYTQVRESTLCLLYALMPLLYMAFDLVL